VAAFLEKLLSSAAYEKVGVCNAAGCRSLRGWRLSALLSLVAQGPRSSACHLTPKIQILTEARHVRNRREPAQTVAPIHVCLQATSYCAWLSNNVHRQTSISGYSVATIAACSLVIPQPIHLCLSVFAAVRCQDCKLVRPWRYRSVINPRGSARD